MKSAPKTILEIYDQFVKRREALIKALVDDRETFYHQCDPDKENLCLYGNPDGTWTVDLPAAEVPPEMPEPVLGINFARNGMEVTDWLSLCAIHSDSWLMALLFFFGARFNYAGRAELFALANQHPTIYEVVTERVGRNTVYKRQDASGNAYLPESLRRVEEPAIRSQPSGRIIRPHELTTALCGKKAELYWPDDGKWYLVEIQSIDMDTKMAKVRYATNEEEELNLLEVIEDNQMSLLG